MDYYEKLIERCKNAGKTETIGKTVAGRDILLFRKGTGAKTLVVGSTHAREHITTELIFGLFEDTEYPFDVVPCLNVDGVLLAKYGVSSTPDSMRRFLLGINGGSTDFSLWKANLNAVDINVNFDALWGSGKQNLRYPSSENYIGKYPESEPETAAAAELIRKNDYSQVVSYHSKGELVYWGFYKNYLHYDEALSFAESIGYRLNTAANSAGGLKDYYDVVSNGLGLTVEVGEDRFSHPYPEKELPKLIKKHKRSLKILYENGEKIAERLYERSSRGG